MQPTLVQLVLPLNARCLTDSYTGHQDRTLGIVDRTVAAVVTRTENMAGAKPAMTF